MIKNSTDLLAVLQDITAHDNTMQVDIRELADQLDIALPALVSLLTELEQRDKIILEIKTSIRPQTAEVIYEGSFRLMEEPME